MAYKKKTWTAEEIAEFKATNERRVKEASTSIVEQFKSGDVPAKLAPIFLKLSEQPSRNWSFSNQLLMLMSGTTDARCLRDWGNVGRQVRKGDKADVFILTPNKVTIRKEDEKTGEEKVKTFLRGFKVGARFSIERTHIANCYARKGTDKCLRCKKTITDTPRECEGAVELWAKVKGDDEKTQQFLSNLPLHEVAKAWGLEVKPFSTKWGQAQGKYWKGIAGRGIGVGVENLATWAHELIHAADDKLGALVERGQHYRSETVAELGGAILLRCMGYERESDLGGAWGYIQHYCKAAKIEPIKACMDVLKRVGEAVTLILETAEKLKTVDAAA